MRKSLVAILAVLGLLCASVLGLAPRTAAGVQCPTAPVQTIAARNCCGRLVVRAPRPGEKGFLQCACAEKRTASQVAVGGFGKLILALPTAPCLALSPTPSHGWRVPAYAAVAAEWRASPPTPPPSLA